jgi:hypothetical protein
MKVKTTYLQMFTRPKRVVLPPREGLVVVHAKKPTVGYYRFLYDAVGRDYGYWGKPYAWLLRWYKLLKPKNCPVRMSKTSVLPTAISSRAFSSSA